MWSGASESTATAEARGPEAVTTEPILDRQEDCLNKELDIPVRGPGAILDQDIRDREAILVQELDILDKQGVLKVAILAIQELVALLRGLEDILAPVLAILDKQEVLKVAILDKQEVPKVAILDPVLLELLGPGVMGMEDIRHSHSRARARDTRVQLQCSPTAICPLVPGREDSCVRG